MSKTYRELIKNNLCANCHKPNTNPGVHCKPCAAKIADRAIKHYYASDRAVAYMRKQLARYIRVYGKERLLNEIQGLS